MANTLLVVQLAVFLVLITGWAMRSMSYRIARGRSYRALAGDERFGDDIQSTLNAIERERLGAAVRVSDDAYEGLKVKRRPHLSREQRRSIFQAEMKTRDEYLQTASLGIFHYIIIFIAFSVIGLVAEEIWMWVSLGSTESRVGVVWGPFSPLYGFGALMFTIVLWNFRTCRWYEVLPVSMGLGAALEQTTGMAMEYFWHAQSWTYIGLPDAITQWVSWTTVCLWGVIGLVYSKLVMPELVWRIGEPSSRMQTVLVGVLVAFMTLDLLMTAYSFYRLEQRSLGIPAQNPIDAYVDYHFNDQFIEDRFQNLVVGQQLDPNDRSQWRI